MANCGLDAVHGGDIPVFYNRSRIKGKFVLQLVLLVIHSVHGTISSENKESVLSF